MSKQGLIIITSDKAKVIRKQDKDKASDNQSNKPSKRLDIVTINGKRRVIVRQD